MRMSQFFLPSALVISTVLLAANFPTAPAVVASVDVEKVYRSLDQLKASAAHIDAISADLEKRVGTIEEEFRTLKDDLESFPPGSAAHNEASRKVVLREGDRVALIEFAKLKIESENIRSVRDAYQAIRSACATLSKEQKIDLVFLDDTIPMITAANLDGTIEQISGRRMLYCNPALDITDALIERMNAEFRAANPSAAPPATPPASAGKS